MEGILSAFSGSLLVSTVCSQKCITSFLKSLWVGIWVGIVVPFTDKEAEIHKCSVCFFLNALLSNKGPLSSICHHSLYLAKLKATRCQVFCVQNLMSTKGVCLVDQNKTCFAMKRIRIFLYYFILTGSIFTWLKKII